MTEEVMNRIVIGLLGGSVALLAAAFLIGGVVIALRWIWFFFKMLWEECND